MRRRNDAPNGLEDISQFNLKVRVPLHRETGFLESRRPWPKRRVL